MEENLSDDGFLGFKKINLNDFISQHFFLLVILLVGLSLIGFGVFIISGAYFHKSDEIEVLSDVTEGQDTQKEIVIDISGEVQKPGVYKMSLGSRVEDLLVVAGGITINADQNFIDTVLNRAAKLSDGQKIVIPKTQKQSDLESAKNGVLYKTISSDFSTKIGVLININTASLNELDTLPGIGPVYAQTIIDHRPYSKTDDLVNNSILKSSVYEKIKDKISVY